jgi:hypothetical protein
VVNRSVDVCNGAKRHTLVLKQQHLYRLAPKT